MRRRERICTYRRRTYIPQGAAASGIGRVHPRTCHSSLSHRIYFSRRPLPPRPAGSPSSTDKLQSQTSNITQQAKEAFMNGHDHHIVISVKHLHYSLKSPVHTLQDYLALTTETTISSMPTNSAPFATQPRADKSCIVKGPYRKSKTPVPNTPRVPAARVILGICKCRSISRGENTQNKQGLRS